MSLTTPSEEGVQLFRHLFEEASLGIAVEDLDGNLLLANPALCSMLGYREEELCAMSCSAFANPKDSEEDWALFQKLRAGLIDRYSLEKRYVRKNGAPIWGRLNVSLFKNSEGGTPLVFAFVEEVTERKLAEDSLRSSEERLRLAQKVARIGTFEWNIQTGVNVWTPELEAMYGLPLGGFGKTQPTFENLVHPDDRARVIDLADSALKLGQPGRGEWRVLWSDGSVHWLAGRWQVLTNESGEAERIIGVNIDITERKRAELALAELNHALEERTSLLQSQEELLRVFIKHVPATVAMLDRDMRYLQVSDRWCADFPVDGSAFLGRSHYELFPDVPDRWKEIHRRALAGETLRSEEDRWDREGGAIWLRWEIRPWQSLDGSPGGIIIFSEDITKRKQVEEALLAVNRRLIEAQEQERNRIGRELHDDNNQRLALLALELQQLQDDPAEVGSRLEELRKQTTELSNDVHALSHELHSSTLEYLGVVAGIKSWCREFGERQRMDIEFKDNVRSVPPFDVGVCLIRVLQEALHNAVKHSGTKRVEVQLSEHSNEVHLIVHDSGRGFDIQAARQGTGLGLTSMRERCRLVSGTISIESKPNGGTTIHVRVPLK